MKLMSVLTGEADPNTFRVEFDDQEDEMTAEEATARSREAWSMHLARVLGPRPKE